MKQYRFIMPYAAQITVGGFVGIILRNYQTGQTVAGTPTDAGVRIRISEPSVFNELTYEPGIDTIIVPYGYLREVTPGSVDDLIETNQHWIYLGAFILAVIILTKVLK